MCKLPQAPGARKAQREHLIRLVAANNLQQSLVIDAAVLAQNHSAVSCAKQTIRAGNHLKGILCLLLARMMDDEQTDVVLIGNFLQFNTDVLVTGIVDFFIMTVADFLQGINNNQADIGIFIDEVCKLLFKAII